MPVGEEHWKDENNENQKKEGLAMEARSYLFFLCSYSSTNRLSTYKFMSYSNDRS